MMREIQLVQKIIIYQGTSKEAINPNNPLKSSGFGDDWLQNAKINE